MAVIVSGTEAYKALSVSNDMTIATESGIVSVVITASGGGGGNIAITPGAIKARGGPVNISRTPLTSSNTIQYKRQAGMVLMLYNTTGSPVVVNIVGTQPVPINAPGYGGPINTSGGKSITVPANATTYIPLDGMWAFLEGNGTVTLANGTGLVAGLLTT